MGGANPSRVPKIATVAFFGGCRPMDRIDYVRFSAGVPTKRSREARTQKRPQGSDFR